jgi:gliding motility-associated-like protein
MTTNFGVKFIYTTVLSVALCISVKAQLTANFTATPVSGCAPLLVNFTDQSSGSPVQWKWDLGNGTISFLQNPSGTYFNPGQYNIKLVVYNAAGDSAVLEKTQYISVYAAPDVAFTGLPLTGCVPLPVSFTDQSTAGSGSISQWQWDFGDGNSSNIQNPSHTYATAGNYNVTLRLTNSFGCIKVLSKPQYIKVNAGAHADFSNTAPVGCHPPTVINFQNLSTGSGILTYQWDFGDGGSSTVSNPSHTYAAAGTYTVRLITTNSAGCSDTIIKSNLITITSINASFSSAVTACLNKPVNFTNTSVPVPTNVIWNFGDATTSTLLNPVKAYTSAGTYQVEMIANFGGCLDTAYQTISVYDNPIADFSAPITGSCKAPFTANFSNSSTGAASYLWLFGDGNTSTVTAPAHTYTTTGNFTVTLIATNINGCSDTIIKTAYIKIQPPVVTINNLPFSGCAPVNFSFSASITSTDPVTDYLWDFGDGSTSTAINPTHVFPTGTYIIKLIVVTASGCTDSAIVNPGIIASVKPTANFTATPRDVCAHMPVNFTDLSTGTATSWSWNFGDGGTSTSQNPIHVYEDTGYFNITLIVCNDGCCDTLTIANYLHVNPPIAAFITGIDCSKPRDRIFTDQSIGADEWNWDFGDGTTSTQQNPIHTYADTGTYTVTLLVKNYTTGCEYSKSIVIKVLFEKANFMVSDTVICRKNSITFTATGNNALNVAAYQWDFGDGSTANNLSATHTYTVAGKYTIRLVVTDLLGCKDTLTKPLYIEVNGPVANFAPAVAGGCLLSAVSFTDNSITDGIHPIIRWIWNYGDGIKDTLTAPPFQHVYAAPGIYTVSLKLLDTKGCTDSVVNNSVLTISKPVANFATTDTLTCPGKNINFTNSSTGPGLQYNWDFGDGNSSTVITPVHQYVSDGIYSVRLIITDQYGCMDTLIHPDYIRIVTPHANFTMSDSVGTCPPLFISFANTSQNFTSVHWDFGDGTSTQTDNPSHFYNTAGTYIAKLTITGPGGCVDIKQKTIVLRGPLGSFNYTPTSGCKPLTVNFTASTQDRLSFIWDFNDGTTNATTDSVLAYTYTIPGFYVPKMILVDTSGCVVPVTGADTIFVRGAIAKFGFTNATFCDIAVISFSDSSLTNDPALIYNWNFGDGNVSTVQNPVHTYTQPGLYTPKLLVTTQSGCRDSAKSTTPVKIVSSPKIAIAGNTAGCAPLTVNFNGQILVPDTSAINWNWNFGNGNTSLLKDPPAQLYNTAGTYTTQLLATNSSGCTTALSKTIDVFLVPTINAGADTLVCRGKATTLTAAGADSYIWSPATGLSCASCAAPLASPDSITQYIVKGTTIHGCSNTDSVWVDVKQPFVMQSSPDDTLCTGNAVRLFASGAFTYTWTPSTGLNSVNIPTPLASPSVTTTYRVIGTDDRACFSDTGFVTVKVYPIPVVDAGIDKTINAGQTVELKPSISADITTVIWTPTQSIVQNNFPNITVKPKETTEYTIEARNPGGCKTRDRVTVFIICNGVNVFIPNTFSPNGDGANDIFYPRGSGLFRIKTFRIFNRWGELIFDKSNMNPNDAAAGWNGKYKGARVNPDVYVYTAEIICENNTVLTLKGNVALIQ